MRVIIVRKEIDPRALLYLFTILILVPYLAYLAVSAVIFRNEISKVRTLIDLKQYNAAEEAMNPVFARYGMKRGSLELLTDLRLAKAESTSAVTDWCALVKAASLLQGHFWYFGSSLDERLGKAYYYLGDPWFSLSLASFDRTGTADTKSTEGAAIEMMRYEMYMAKKDFIKAVDSVKSLSLAHPEEIKYRRMHAETLLAQGNPFKAQDELKSVVFKGGWNDEIRKSALSLTALQNDLNLKEELEFTYIYCMQKAPDDSDLLKGYGLYLYSQGQVREGRKLWAKGMSNPERKKEFQRLLARMH